jgi:hypothetical protein
MHALIKSRSRIFAHVPHLYVPLSSTTPRRFISSKCKERELVDEKTLSDYDPRRHCPIERGNTLGKAYTTLVKLGYGRTSTTWLCKDGRDVIPGI